MNLYKTLLLDKISPNRDTHYNKEKSTKNYIQLLFLNIYTIYLDHNKVTSMIERYWLDKYLKVAFNIKFIF